MNRMDLEELVEILEGDRELLELLAEHGLIPDGAAHFGPSEVETVLISRTLVRELEVNWPGVEVILRMRQQLLVTRRRLAELAAERDKD